MLTKIILIAAVAAAVAFFFKSRGPMISGAQAQALVADGATLVDVRSPSEYASGHIEGAVNIPVDGIAARADELGDKSAPVVVYCQSGMRSGRAKGILEGAGFTHVSNMGGVSRWPSGN